MNLQGHPTPGGYGWGTGTPPEDPAFCRQSFPALAASSEEGADRHCVDNTTDPREAERTAPTHLSGQLGELRMAPLGS